MPYETLLTRREGAVATVTINRPDALNALNRQVFTDLADYLRSVEDDPEVLVIVLQGAGERAFVAGADIKDMVEMSASAAVRRSWQGMLLYDRIRHQPQPVIASVQGYALGGGMLLAMACDVRIAADDAVFGYPEIRLGIFPGTGGTVLIDRLIGPGVARAICLTGERFDAVRAFQLGIVTHLVPADRRLEETGRLAALLAGYSPVAVRELKGVLNASMEQDFETARQVELAAYGRTFDSADRVEGMRAFVEKRPPRFRGV